MIDLRGALEAKARRRAVVPIPLRDTGEARQRVEAATAARLAAEGAASLTDGPTDFTALDAEVGAAQDALAACTADLRLSAPSAADAEAIHVRHCDTEGAVDWLAALPEFLAVCCDDEGLRDAEWWRGQLARPEWSPAEVTAVKLAVMHLVVNGPRAYIPKD
jgi:hypothetical protein